MAPKNCFLCEEPSTLSCSHCKLIQACSEKHMKLHRPENLCFPFKVAKDPIKGRIMVAVRDIQPMGKAPNIPGMCGSFIPKPFTYSFRAYSIWPYKSLWAKNEHQSSMLTLLAYCQYLRLSLSWMQMAFLLWEVSSKEVCCTRWFRMWNPDQI